MGDKWEIFRYLYIKGFCNKLNHSSQEKLIIFTISSMVFPKRHVGIWENNKKFVSYWQIKYFSYQNRQFSLLQLLICNICLVAFRKAQTLHVKASAGN